MAPQVYYEWQDVLDRQRSESMASDAPDYMVPVVTLADHRAAVEEAVTGERERITAAVKAYYKVAPKAAEPILRLIEEK